MSRRGEPRVRPLERLLVRAAWVFGVLSGLTGAIVFAGWMLLGPAALQEWSGPISMKTNAALAMLLAGAGLVLLIPEQATGGRRGAGRMCAAVVLALGALTFSEHVFGWKLGIDQLLATEPPGAAGVTSPNRMGPPASFSFLLLGPALLLLGRQSKLAGRAALHQSLALVRDPGGVAANTRLSVRRERALWRRAMDRLRVADGCGRSWPWGWECCALGRERG